MSFDTWLLADNRKFALRRGDGATLIAHGENLGAVPKHKGALMGTGPAEFL
jgi:hypothetical protein